VTPEKKPVLASRRLPAPVQVLFGSQFGLFFLGNNLSLVGTWMQRLACGWLVWQWTHSAFWLGVLSAGDLLPGMVIGPFAGVVADRWNRLRLNMFAQIASALLAVLTAVLIAMDDLGLIGLVLLITAQGTLAAAIQPARLAMVQQMVPREHTGTAVALSSVSVNLARLVGPAVAGIMILKMDISWVFIINALFTLVLVVILARLRLRPQAIPARAHSFFGEMVEGFAHILRDQALWLILLVMLCGGSMVRAMMELIPAIAASTFSGDATGLAVLTGAGAFGAVASGLAMGPGRAPNLLYGILPWWGIGAVAAIVLARAHSSAIAVSAAVVIGFTVTRSLASTQIFVQLTTPERLRGRVLSVHGLIARGSPALGALIIGFAADRTGLARAVEVSAGALVLSLLALVPLIKRAALEVEEAA
jgi:predicted MFS family arabinose efflux permease